MLPVKGNDDDDDNEQNAITLGYLACSRHQPTLFKITGLRQRSSENASKARF